ncbi:hypothetical protein TWF569_007663 [Orbilia oligospora]|uniref:NADH-ubiquinone oxidoreductase 14 kDa subunit n=2 Tax=Orbilia oligospora TaxID=2813651 RepID=G1WYZ2_ARTOA|nr:hypothetical protein AOL_s00004g503 [Orbilia oligospora ATCC 24927]KAF3093908.1 hypothetical protein TWF102_007732 [Orbilia oligospora]EGX53844.1 hypothetical protein AOL_s00004g503 [Orbilia oligospora ATCC 24927]KAF3102050.1 hypothetical protein TWF103_007697 [Orbilia oligospora]KAF3109447.1 hypothetical protein TWF706_001319 [Orbilia oligospora]KAF3134123.1 hypothetical protein TWF703_006455 [Orbilia oligospora]
MSSIAFYAFFGAAARFMQLGIQKRPHYLPSEAIAYPLYMSISIGAGLWLDSVEDKHMALLQDRKKVLIEKRARREEELRSFARDHMTGDSHS